MSEQRMTREEQVKYWEAVLQNYKGHIKVLDDGVESAMAILDADKKRIALLEAENAELKTRITLLEAALRNIRDAMSGTDDAADRVQRIIGEALQEDKP